MAAAGQQQLSRADSRISLEIRTKSVEQTLIPLVTQITTLVNHKEKPKVTDKTARALCRVGEAVRLAVQRFVSVGQSIGEENPEIEEEMCEACRDAQQAGSSIQRLTDMNHSGSSEGPPKTFTEKTAMVRSARKLLSAITKVLLIADKVIVKQLLFSKEKVLTSLDELEGVENFADFVQAFSKFGSSMVELAHLTGDRQNDLKSDKHRAQMGSARAVLEKSTMMLLPSCKTCLRHPECESAKQNMRGLFVQMRNALDLIHHIVTDGWYPPVMNGDVSPTVNGDSGIGLPSHLSSSSKAMKEFDDQVELTRVTFINKSIADKLSSALEVVIETSQEFTDSAYTSHEHRERIVQLSDQLQHTVQMLIRTGSCLNQKDSCAAQDLETAILKTLEVSRSLRKQLQDTAMDQASELFKTNEDHDLLRSLRTAGIAGELHSVEELSVKFEEHTEQLQEVCKLFRHIASTDPLVITAEHNEAVLSSMGPLILQAARTLAEYPGSRIAKENLDMFADAWESQINDLSILVKEVNDVCQGKTDRQVYLSLPRPGKHGTTSKSLRPAKLDAEEQAKIAKLGLEMKLITSEMDAETDKWEEPDNDIVKRAKNMSSMAFSMYLFTRGEGPLKTTQDLFVQAEYFAEEGNKLYKTVRDFSHKVPQCAHKEELCLHLERIPSCCQQLHTTLKATTFGKSATFNKVDSAIQETKNLMNAIAKVVTTCFVCATKYNIDYRTSPCGTQRWRGSYEGPRSGTGSDSESVMSSHSEYQSSSSNRLISSGTSFE